MNSKNSKSKIKRRNFFLYLGAGAASVFALTKLPIKIFQQKVKSDTALKVKTNPYAVKRDNVRGGKNNG
jgi:hypothetical protein